MFRRRILRAGLCALAVATALVAGACAKKKSTRTLYVPGGATTVTIDLRFPLSATTNTELDFSYVCADAKAILVSLDLGTSATPIWGAHLLYGLDGSLWGCTESAPCPDTKVRLNFGRPSRVAIEGIDVAPADYAASATHNVICRGVADSISGMGSIVATVVPTPTPSPQASVPPSQTSLDVAVSVPLLRVGDVNGTYSTAGAIDPGVLGESLVPEQQRALRVSSGGIGVFTDYVHVVNARFLEFRPWDISMEATSTFAAETRAQPTAAAFVDSAGRPALFISGGSAGGSSVDSVEIYRHGALSTQSIPYAGGPLNLGTVTAVPDHRESGVTVPALVMLGGCSGVGGGSPTFNSSYTIFFPAAPVDLTGCLAGAVVGGPALCRTTPETALGDGGHCSFSAVRITTPSGPRILTQPGYQAPTGAISANGYSFDPETRIGSGPLTLLNTPAVISTRPVALSTALVAYFGGYTSAGVGASNWSYFRGSDSAIVGATTSKPITVHSAHSQLRLLDGRVAIFGGSGSADPRTIEEFVPSAGADTAGTFTYVRRSPAGPVCGQPTDGNCVRFALNRQAPGVVQIWGSDTWINGSIVVSGGTGTSNHSTELFVPAYDCADETPIMPKTGGPVAGVDFCDRQRSKIPILDPSAPGP